MKTFFLLLFGASLLTIFGESYGHAEQATHWNENRQKPVHIQLKYTDGDGNKVNPSKIKKPISYFPYSLIDVNLDNLVNHSSVYYYDIKFYNASNNLVDIVASYHRSKKFSMVPKSMMHKYQHSSKANQVYFFEFVYYNNNMQIVTNFSNAKCHEKIYIHKNLRNGLKPLKEASKIVYFKYHLTNDQGMEINNYNSYLRKLKTPPPFPPNIIFWSKNKSPIVENKTHSLTVSNPNHYHHHNLNNSLTENDIKVFFYNRDMTQTYTNFIMNYSGLIEYVPKNCNAACVVVYYDVVFRDFNGALIPNLTNYVASYNEPSFLPFAMFDSTLPNNTIYFDTLYYFANGTQIINFNSRVIDPITSVTYRPRELQGNPSLSVNQIYYEYGSLLPNGTVLSLTENIINSPLFITPQIVRWLSFFLKPDEDNNFVTYFYANGSSITSIESYVRNLEKMVAYIPFEAHNLANPFNLPGSAILLYRTTFYNYNGEKITSRRKFHSLDNIVLSPLSAAGLFSPSDNVIFFKHTFYYQNGTVIPDVSAEISRWNHSIIYQPMQVTDQSEFEIVYYKFTLSGNATSFPPGLFTKPLMLWPQIFSLFRYQIYSYVKYTPRYYQSGSLSFIPNLKQFIKENGRKMITYAPKDASGVPLSDLLQKYDTYFYTVIFYNVEGNNIRNLAEFIDQLNGTISLAPASRFYDLSLRSNYSNIVYYETVFYRLSGTNLTRVISLQEAFQNKTHKIIYQPLQLHNKPNWMNETELVYYDYEFSFENGTLIPNNLEFDHLIQEPLSFFPQFSHYLTMSQSSRRYLKISYKPVYFYSNMTQIRRFNRMMKHIQGPIIYRPHPNNSVARNSIDYYYKIEFYDHNQNLISSMENYTMNLVGTVNIRPLPNSWDHQSSMHHSKNLIYYSFKYYYPNGSLITNVDEAFTNTTYLITYIPYSLLSNSNQTTVTVYYTYEFKHPNGSIVTNDEHLKEKIKKPLALFPYGNFTTTRTISIAISYHVQFYCSQGKRIPSLRKKIYSTQKPIIYAPKSSIRLRRPEDLPHSVIYDYDLIFFSPNGSKINLTNYIQSRVGRILLRPISMLNTSNLDYPNVQNVVYYQFIFYYPNGTLIVDYPHAFRGKCHLIIYRPKLNYVPQEYEIIYYEYFFRNRDTGKQLYHYQQYLNKIEKPLTFLPQVYYHSYQYSEFNYYTNFYYYNLTRINHIEQFVRNVWMEIVYVPKIFRNVVDYYKYCKIFYYKTRFYTLKGNEVECLPKYLKDLKGPVAIMSKSKCSTMTNKNMNVICYEFIYYDKNGYRVDNRKAFYGNRGLIIYRPVSALRQDSTRSNNYLTVFYDYTFKNKSGAIINDTNLLNMINFPLTFVPQINYKCSKKVIEIPSDKCCKNNISVEIDTKIKLNFDLNKDGLSKILPYLGDIIRQSPYLNNKLVGQLEQNKLTLEEDEENSQEDCEDDYSDEYETSDEEISNEYSNEEQIENADKQYHSQYGYKKQRKFDLEDTDGILENLSYKIETFDLK